MNRSYIIILLGIITLASSSKARRVDVATYVELRDACQSAIPGDSIIIASGEYTITGNNRIMITNRPGPVLVRSASGDPASVIIQGVSMNEDIVEIIFNLDNCPQWIFDGFSTRNTYYHAFKFDHGSTDCIIRNVFMRDHGECGIKGTSDNVAKTYPDRLLVEHCVIGFSTAAGSVHPVVEGIDAVGVNDWIIRSNRFINIQKSGFDSIAYAVFTKGNSSRTIIERNRFEDCFIGISFGGGGTSAQFFRDSNITFEHRDGIIRNNVIIRCNDAGIYINKGNNCKIYNNTLIQCVATIQLRFTESSGNVKNNLILPSSQNVTEPLVRIRDGATLISNTANLKAGAQEFINIIGASVGVNAQLRELSGAIDKGVTLPDVPTDFILTPRPQGKAYDVGAFEFIPSSVNRDVSKTFSLATLCSIEKIILQLRLTHEGFFSLTIFDILGRNVSELVTGHFEQGEYSFALPSSLRTGTYFAALKFDAEHVTTKFIVNHK